MTIPLSAGLIIGGFLARKDLSWLWFSSACLFLQWFTDSFDGSLGRYRDTGIPKWGYYMDHLLDYVFLCSILVGYALLFDSMHRMLFLLMIPVFGLFYVSSYLAFAATHEFKITFLGTGPTELRLFLILLNTALIVLGTGFLKSSLLFVLCIACAAMCVVVYRTQKYIWYIDMHDKEQRKKV
jgi:phosphatidylglycerophosphate synthase